MKEYSTDNLIRVQVNKKTDLPLTGLVRNTCESV